jgi:hypothetical protein
MTDSETEICFKDEPWGHILKCLPYKGENSKVISATQMKNAKKTWNGVANQFEPRLLCYHTSSLSRPESLQKNNLCILPIKNGEYLLTKTNIYKSLSYEGSNIVSIKRDTSSLILNIGESETSLIDNLRYSGIFERPEILGEPITHGPLLNGRHRTDTFKMKLGNEVIQVQGVQYEVDACFETENQILILEGKSNTREIGDFNIRQLYYPYRTILNIVGEKKEILCGFLHQHKGIIHIWLFTFEDPMCMNSIKQVGHSMYKFSS